MNSPIYMKPPPGKQLLKLIYLDWNQNKTLAVFDFFKNIDHQPDIPLIKPLKLNKTNQKEFQIQNLTGGPGIFDDKFNAQTSIMTIMKAIKVWKTKKAIMNAKKFEKKCK